MSQQLVEQLRQRNGVRLVSEAEEGCAATMLGPGTYGFTNSPVLQHSPLYRKQVFRSFELHKVAGGSIHLIVFVRLDQAAAIEKGDELEDCDLYPEPFEAATHPVSIETSRLYGAKNPSRDRGNFIRCGVKSSVIC